MGTASSSINTNIIKMAEITVLSETLQFTNRLSVVIKDSNGSPAAAPLIDKSNNVYQVAPIVTTVQLDAGSSTAGFDSSSKPPPFVTRLDAAYAGFRAGTVDLCCDIVAPGSSKNGRPNGDVQLYAVPKGGRFWIGDKDRLERRANVLVSLKISGEPNRGYIEISALVRAGLLPQHIAASERAREIEATKNKANGGLFGSRPTTPVPVLDPLPYPTVPATAVPLKAPVQRYSNFLNFLFRAKRLMTVRGHRILFIEAPETPYINKRLVWEARLLYPNYPGPLPDVSGAAGIAGGGPSGMDPVEGNHYTLLLRHRDDSSCCHGACCGCSCLCYPSVGRMAFAKLKLDLIESLATTPAPPSSTAAGPMDATPAELAMLVLSMVPSINTEIYFRNVWVARLPWTVLIGALMLASVIINLVSVNGPQPEHGAGNE
ncbi:hypothetical protein BC828DRAFT_224076 [Blastocladiella britannica]|nr:hypothetical protein BC828DRAFT_224076 [Blastocladiella britannica]